MGTLINSLVIYPLTQIIELVFMFCKKLFDDTGFAIIGVSCAVSLLTLPLYIVAEHWQQIERNKQKAMKSQIEKIKAVFKGNEQYMILSTYYRQQHYHPIMALRSAFGLLIQIPFFTAAYACLSHMTALQGHSFLFIRDMGAPDSLFMIGAFHVNVLPILMTIINMVSGTIYTRGFPIKDKLYTYGLALIFVIILYDSPAGLVMYWTMNNLFSLVKNIFYKMRHPVKALYYIACALVTALIIWIFAAHVLSITRALLVSFVFALVYPAPLYVRFANWLIDNPYTSLRDNFKLRLSLFAVSAVALTLLLGYFIPTNLIASSPEEFSGIDGIGNPMFFVKNTLSQAAGFCLVWASLIFFLYHERMQTLIATGLSIIFGMCILNNFAFPEDYGNLSKLLIFTDIGTVDSTPIKIAINALALAIFAAALFFVFKCNKTKIFNSVLSLAAISLFGMGVMNSVTITKGYKSYEEKVKANGIASMSKIEPIFHLSKTGKNVLYIYLDKAQNRYIEEMFREIPELQEQFSGFTLYKNTVSFNGHTLLGAPSVYGGYEYTPEAMNARSDVSLVDKQNECLLVLPRIFTEQTDGNWSATVTDSTWANYSWTPDLSIYKGYPSIDAHLTDAVYLDLWYKEHQDTAQISVTSDTLKRNILWYGFFKSSPLFLRPAFYNDGVYWSANKTNDDFNDYLNGYSVLDYLKRFTDFNASKENVYINLTNNCPHDSLFLQAPEYRPSSKITNKGTSSFANDSLYHSNAGAIRRIGEWFQYLKSEGVYDNCRIVLVADHGSSGKEGEYVWDEKFEKMQPGHYHPLLMFKDFNESGNLKVNTDFMTNADTPLLLTQGIVDNPTNPFTGKKLEADKENGALICTSDIFMPYQNSSKYVFTVKDDQWLRVSGNIFDSANWSFEPHKQEKK
ncbi:YidC/Oxa1 family membrane protein insertase [Treponema saccharophilum]|uniref:60 kDa inner membrane insertion protein n=1 Tax=Treponema saccharophilum DSM 2985 TaxID=907348 RepID=H7EMI2_9SPIR|nr:YidC/Oxa1 family membrane protein insertase [Treponema saccharophilum]EIC01267.1 60 kDa inner membrane insertion protein [Treponema saccharophilum DSM 2985]BDC96021.1 membrane protein [Treponema saccharophilum]